MPPAPKKADPRAAMTGRAGLASRKTGRALDADEFLAEFEDTVRKLRLRSEDELEEFGKHAADTIRELAPAGPTRDLREGIGYELGRDHRGPYVDIYTRRFYSSFLEWGTSKMRARPFFRPGLAQASTTFPTFFRRLLAGAARRLSGR